MRFQRHAIYLLIGCVLFLIVTGMVMLSSTSAFAQDSHGDMNYFIKRQAVWLLVGLIVCVGVAMLDYRLLQKYWWVFFGAAVVLLALCFIPPIGMRLNGSWRWVRFGPVAFQPSEIAKIAAVLFVAWWYARYDKEAGSFLKGFVIPPVVIMVMVGLIAMETDLGTAALISAVTFAVMFVAGVNLAYVIPIAAVALAGVIYAATKIEERMLRLLAFLDPEKYKLEDGLQQYQALIAFGSGGIHGLGLGDGRQKMLYLPYAHTDFIFPMIGEELGLTMTLLTVIAMLTICLCGAVVALNARDQFGMLAGFGAIMVIAIQAAINIGMTTSLLPNKGMPLPFISYGGSNLLICLFLVGLLISIHRQGIPVPERAPRASLRPRLTPRV